MAKPAEETVRLKAAAAEATNLRERIENQFRDREILEKRLEALAASAGTGPEVIVIADPIPPPDLAGEASPRLELAPYMPPDPPADEEPWWPSGEQAPPPLVPSPGWGCFSLHGEHLKVLGISVCGFDRDKLAQVVEMIVERQRAARDFKPVFLTDSLDFNVFRRHGFVFEYLPPRDKRDGHRSPDEWRAYAAARRDFVVRKWNITEVIQFGARAFGE